MKLAFYLEVVLAVMLIFYINLTSKTHINKNKTTNGQSCYVCSSISFENQLPNL